MIKGKSTNEQGAAAGFILGYEEVKAHIIELLSTPAEFDDDRNLLELGLSSLQVMRLVNQWRKMGAAVSFADLISSPSLGQWWPLLSKKHGSTCGISGIESTPAQEDDSGNLPFPLTDVQYAYWIGRRSDQYLGGIGCHGYLEADGQQVDSGRLEAAWNQLLAYHPMLRTRFLPDGRQQVMEKPADQSIVVNDLRDCTEEQVLKQLTSIRSRLSHRLMNIEQGEVAGLQLSLLPEGKTRLHFDIDLLAADVQSFQIILRDLAAAYVRNCRPQAPKNWSFAQYLRQEEQRKSEEREKAKEYWRSRITTMPAGPAIPIKENPENIRQPVFKRRECLIEAEVWAMLKKRSAQHRVTPAMALLTAYALVLERWSADSRFLINIPLFDRQTADARVENVVADFTNLLLLEVDCRFSKSFLEQAQQVQKQFHQDMANTAYSGIQVQRDMARLSQGERVFAPIVFSCNLGVPLINDEFREAFGNIGYMISQTPQVWLDFQLFDLDGGLLLIWDGIDELFPDGMLDQMFAAYRQIIYWLTEEDNTWLILPEVVSDVRQQQREQRVGAPEKNCLHTPFFKKAGLYPDKIALIEGVAKAKISYGELAEYALQIAAVLQEEGVREGHTVAITLPRGIDQIAAVLGVLAAGACYVPVGLQQPAARSERICRKADIHYVIIKGGLTENISWTEGMIVINLDELRHVSPLTEPAKISANSSAYVIFTSGSTGEPKGVEMSHAAVWNTIADINRRYQINEEDKVLAVSALDFDLSVYDIFGMLSAGGSLVLINDDDRRTAVCWLNLMKEYRISLWNSVPVLFDMLLIEAESSLTKLPDLRVVMLSGDWIGLDIPGRLKAVAVDSRLVAMGGATEAAIWSNYYDVTLPLPEHWTSIPYGAPLNNQVYRVVDSKGRDCPDWTPGELWIGGAGVAQGYIGDPELTDKQFVNVRNMRWYRTGDVGRFWADGTIEFLGRRDFQVKIRGHRIELGEIEAVLRKCPGIKNAVVSVAGDLRGSKQLTGYIIPDEEQQSALFQAVETDLGKIRQLWDNILRTGQEIACTKRYGKGEENQFQLFREYREGLAAVYLCRALKKADAYCEVGDSYTISDLMDRCNICSRYQELIEQWMESLEERGLVSRDQSGIWTNKRSFPATLEDLSTKNEDYPCWITYRTDLIKFLDQFDQKSVELLKGEIDPLELFFSDGFQAVDDFVQKLPGAEFKNHIAKGILKAASEGLQDGRAVKILELGSRSLQLTGDFLTLLSVHQAEFCCTDVSAFFIDNAQKQFKDYPNVKYRQLDINEDPLSQGYEANSYDIIIASNSLHRARNIRTALNHIASLLSPGGILLAMEMTENSRLQQISTGFMENGFTHFEDDRQFSRQPLFSAYQWKEMLQSGVFDQAAVFPEPDEPMSVYGQHVIVACSSCRVKTFKAGAVLNFLNDFLPEYMIPSMLIPMKALPVTANGKIDRKALPRPNVIQKDKDYIAPKTPVEVSLAGIWTQILKVEKISRADDYFELGGDSLLATQLNARVRQTFNIELSLETIFKKPVFAELAEAVQRLLEEKVNGGKGPDGLQLPQAVPQPEEAGQPFPLTDIQQSYWIGRSGVYSLGNVSTHCYFEMDAQHLDIKRINNAWQRLINHHAMMRAVILPDGQGQKIHTGAAPYQIKVYDFQVAEQAEAETQLNNIRECMAHRKFNPDQWPLFDIRISLLGKGRIRLHTSFDNIVFDGWSIFHLFKEWKRLYDCPGDSLPVIDLTFRDYVMALEEVKKTTFYQQDIKYWQNRLSDLPPAPELPLSRNPDLLSEQRFSRFEKKLNRTEWQAIKRKAAENGLTPAGILLSAYAEVLGAWSKRAQFTINLTRFNRLPLHPQVNELVGDFTSLTLLAVDLSSGKTFIERSKHLQEQLWRDLDHPYVSGVFVQRELGRISEHRQAAVMPVVFTSGLGIEQERENDTGGQYLGKINYGISQTPQVWLDHQVSEQDGGLILSWDAIKDIFPEGMLEDMFAAYCKLIGELSGSTAVWSRQASRLIDIPHREKRLEANATDAPVAAETLIDLFGRQVEKNRNKPAVISPDRTLTYDELFIRSNAVAYRLAEEKIQPNSLVAVVMEKGWEQVTAVLGILKAGAAYLPIDAGYPEERIHLLLREGNVRIVLTQPSVNERVNWPEDSVRLFIDQPGEKEQKEDLCLNKPKPEDLAYVIYTSGSTGSPKGVMIDHRGAVNTILDINKRFEVGVNDRTIALSNLNFDLSVYDIFGMLAAGGAVVIPDAAKIREPAHWLELIQKEKVTIWNTVPAFMQMLAEYQPTGITPLGDTLRLVLLSGDWIPLTLPDRIKEIFKGTRVIGLGGATEASIWSNMFIIEDIDASWKSIPYGKPLTNQRYYVLNELMEDCPVWVPGQLYIGGIGVARGYWNDIKKTQEKFIVHPRTGERLYCTGDLGRYLPDGNIEFLGREDSQVKVNGYRIELGEIEANIRQLAAVKDVVVGAFANSAGHQNLIAYIVLNEEEQTEFFYPQNSGDEKVFDSEKFSSRLNDKIPRYMIPAVYVLVKALPLSANGKIDRKALAQLASQKEATRQELSVAPFTSMQIKIAKIWEEVLNYKNPGIEDDFFEHGGDSLRAMQLINLLKKRHGIEVPLQSLFETSRIVSLAQAVEGEFKEAKTTEVEVGVI